MKVLLWIENIANVVISRFIENPNIIITWIIGLIILVVAIKVANKLLKFISSIVFIFFMLVKVFGLNTIISLIS